MFHCLFTRRFRNAGPIQPCSHEELLYAKTHEWVHVDRECGQPYESPRSAFRHFAVEALTDLVYIELPAVGRTVKAGESFGEIESVKAVSDMYSPVTGEVIEVNQTLAERLDVSTTIPTAPAGS